MPSATSRSAGHLQPPAKSAPSARPRGRPRFPDEACKAQSAKEYVFALPFKKHLGETLEEVMRKDLGYVECIVRTVRIDKLASLLNTALAELE